MKFIKRGIMQTKQTDYYVYMLKNGAVKCGNPFDDLNSIDDKFSILQTTADSPESAISEFLDNLELPQFMRDKIKVV